jgi:hypothetical protein
MEESIGKVLEMLKPFFEGLGDVHWFAIVLMVIGGLRLVMKPALSIFYAYAAQSPSTSDDEWAKKLQESKILAAVLYVFDWFGSFKMPPKK